MKSLARLDVVPLCEAKVNQHGDSLLRHEDVGRSVKAVVCYQSARGHSTNTYLMSLWTTPRLCRKLTPESRERNHGFECFSGTSTGTRRGW